GDDGPWRSVGRRHPDDDGRRRDDPIVSAENGRAEPAGPTAGIRLALIRRRSGRFAAIDSRSPPAGAPVEKEDRHGSAPRIRARESGIRASLSRRPGRQRRPPSGRIESAMRSKWFSAFGEAEYRDRLARARESLARAGFDGCVSVA